MFRFKQMLMMLLAVVSIFSVTFFYKFRAWTTSAARSHPVARTPVPTHEYVNVALRKATALSSVKLPAALAVDGVLGWLESGTTLGEFACSQLEHNPFWEVDLGQVFLVSHVDVFFPPDECDSYTFPEKSCDRSGLSVLSREQPLVVTVHGGEPGDNGIPVTSNFVSRQFTSCAHHVCAWNSVGFFGKFVRVSILHGEAVLALSEVRVYSKLDIDAVECTQKCVRGSCVCAQNGCKKKECVCEPDWVGPDCSTHVMTSWLHLPPPPSLVLPASDLSSLEAFRRDELWRWSWLCVREQGEKHCPVYPASDSWFDAPMSLKLLRQLHQQQFEGSCSRLDTLPSEIFYNAGMFSTVKQVAGLLSAATASSKALVMEKTQKWVYASGCSPQTFSCYFREWSSCASDNLDSPSTHSLDFANMSLYESSPAPYTSKGLFWWQAHLMAFLLQPNEATQNNISLARVMRSIEYSHPIIGLHVRHGDACTVTLRSGHCRPFEDYLPGLALLSSRYNTNRVFIATDDPGVLADSQKHNHRYNFIYVDMDRESLTKTQDEWIERRLAQGVVDAHKLSLSTLTDVQLLAAADALLLSLASAMSRTALELATVARGSVPPFISMDSPWCHHWRMCCNLQSNGNSSVC